MSIPITRKQLKAFADMQASPFQGPKVCKDLVAFFFHLAVDAADVDLLDQSLECSTEILHTRTRAEEKMAAYR